VPMSQVVVNATSVGLKAPDESPLPDSASFDPDGLAVDLVYRLLKTKFLRQARGQDVRTVDGLEILVHQAIGALSLWLGRSIDVERLAPVMRAAALEALL
jgi:shikimate dehydrogenase